MTRSPFRVAPGIATGGAISADTWMWLTWSGGLLLGAAAGAVVALLWGRRLSRAGSSRLVVYAWALFAVYASWHLVAFWRAMLGM